MDNTRTHPIRFGVFEADPAAGVLRRSGRLVKLQDQPFRLLLLLLEHPGEVVTREELREKLWGDTFVDFEEGLRTAIRKLRDALDDSASNPRFIETIPRKGYRFIAPVQSEGEPAPAPVQTAPANRRWIWGAAAVAVLLSGAGAWVWRGSRQAVGTGRVPVLSQVTVDPGWTTEPTVWPAGNMVAYASDRAGSNLDIWVQNLATNETRRLTTNAADDREPAFSPDGSRIAFRSERDGGGIYVVPALGGEERRITNGGRGPSYSPDGKWIAYYEGVMGFDLPYAYNGPALYIVPAAGGPPVRLVPNFAGVSQPVWSPDGANLLISGGPTFEDIDWWVIPIAGGNPVRIRVRDLIQAGKFLRRRPTAWSNDAVYFTAAIGDTRNIWKVRIDPKTFQLMGDAESVTSGSGVEEGARIAGDRVIFSSQTSNTDLWSLPLEPNSGKVLGDERRITQELAPNDTVSIDASGRYLAFRTFRRGVSNIVWRDLNTGQERVLGTSLNGIPVTRISPDGSRVSFNAFDEGKATIQIVPVAGGAARKVADEVGARGWMPNGQELIVTSQPRQASGLLDLATGKVSWFLPYALTKIGHSAMVPSSDGRWMVFYYATDNGRSLIWVAPVRRTRVPKEEWIQITDGQHWDAVTELSPDGNMVYFFSDRDGFRCHWAIRLDPVTKKPIGNPFAIRHYHNARLSPGHVRFGRIGNAVARDKIVFTMAELTGNIWMLEHSK